jgi:mRNA interferase MazF
MLDMTDYNFGDIVLLPFPFTDQTTTKKRPAVIISSSEYNNNRPDVIAMAVTSRIKPMQSFGEMTINDWKQAGLIKESAIKPIMITIEKGLLLDNLPRLMRKICVKTCKPFWGKYRFMYYEKG